MKSTSVNFVLLKRLLQLGVLVSALAAGLATANPGNSPDAIPDIPDIHYAEELVDIVLQHCRAGDVDQARAISQAIAQQLSPPTEILNLLAEITQTGCPKITPQAQGSVTEWTLSTGFDDNINQGLNADSITLGSTLKPITLVLDSDYKPVGSHYVATTATHQRHTENGWLLRGTLGHKQIGSYSKLSNTGLHLSAKYELRPLDVPSALQLGWSQTWLDQRHDRRLPSIEWQSQLGKDERDWKLHAQVQQLQHQTNSTENARTYALRVTRQYRWTANTSGLMGAGWLSDQARQQRAGGDRQGHTLQFTLQHILPQGPLQLHWSQVRWASGQNFSPNLVDYRRQNTTTQWSLSQHIKLSPHSHLYLEFQRTAAQDNVPLYQHTSNSLMAGWIQQWR